jgi:hypothetical protein
MKNQLLIYSKMEEELEKLKTINQPIGYTKDSYPIIISLKIGNQAKWYCDKCKKFHSHGCVEGYRYSHCKWFYRYYLLVLDVEDIDKVLKGGEIEIG